MASRQPAAALSPAATKSPSRAAQRVAAMGASSSLQVPMLASTATSSSGGGGGVGVGGVIGPDPATILKSLDKRRQSIVATAAGGGAGAATSQAPAPLDPIEFLNRYYTSEQVLVAQLPHLRQAVSERMQLLDDRISTALQRQSETAESTRRHVQEAKSNVAALESRILQVRSKASQSERAVLEITKDMKKLDCAKRHLQRTITTLKRLHMLVNAVEQLRLASLAEPFPDYRAASQLVDATRLLLKHFDAYTQKVEPMRLLSSKVTHLQKDLRLSLVRGFRIVAFGVKRAKEIEDGVGELHHKYNSFTDGDPDDDFEEEEEGNHDGGGAPVMTPDVMQGGVLLVDALGDDVRVRFIHEFCQDHLANYLREFEPPSREREEKRVSSFRVQETKPEDEKSVAGLDQIEKRFTWFRGVVQNVDAKFPKIFPPHWNLQASLARHFLQLVCYYFIFIYLGNCLFSYYRLLKQAHPFYSRVVGRIRREIIFWRCWMGREKIPTRTTPLYC